MCTSYNKQIFNTVCLNISNQFLNLNKSQNKEVITYATCAGNLTNFKIYRNFREICSLFQILYVHKTKHILNKQYLPKLSARLRLPIPVTISCFSVSFWVGFSPLSSMLGTLPIWLAFTSEVLGLNTRRSKCSSSPQQVGSKEL